MYDVRIRRRAINTFPVKFLHIWQEFHHEGTKAHEALFGFYFVSWCLCGKVPVSSRFWLVQVRDIARLPKAYPRLVSQHIDSLREDPRPPDTKKLRGATNYSSLLTRSLLCSAVPTTLLPVSHYHQQHRQAECLVACAAMVLDYLQVPTSYARLLDQFYATIELK